MNWSAFTTGFALSGTLIVAIGAQNAFVLQQGLKREHVAPVVLFCAAADLLLVAFGVAGVAGAVARSPLTTTLLVTGGTLFLVGYGLRALARAFGAHSLRGGQR